MVATDIEPAEPVTPNERFWTANAMIVKGGSFVYYLGCALLRADHINTEKIKEAWPEYWEKYYNLGKKRQEENNDQTKERNNRG